MKTFRTREIPARTEQEIDTITCDLCGRIAPRRSVLGVWGENSYEVAEVKVEMTTGEAFPDSSSTKTLAFDICPQCFKHRLMAWMETQGAAPTEREHER